MLLPAQTTGASRPVSSPQVGVHPRLRGTVSRHATAPWLKPPHRPSEQAFRALESLLGRGGRERVVLDAGCGTGESTRALATLHPDSVVIGLDRSEHRLRKTGHRRWPVREGRIVYVRSKLETFWWLAHQAGWRLQAQYLLYPNPWPKPSQLKRRWHAHPVFPHILALGGDLVMRCNWDIYAREFARAAGWLTGEPAHIERLSVSAPLTPFERKYAASGHALFEVRVSPGCARLPSGRKITGSGTFGYS